MRFDVQVIRIGEQIYAEVSVKDVADNTSDILPRCNINKPIYTCCIFTCTYTRVYDICKTCTVSLHTLMVCA